MESKYNNPYKPPQAKGAYIKPPQFKIAQNAPVEPITKQDDTSILDLYTQFKTREYDDLMKIIESNEILNFKTDKGETLIFALLNNSSSSLNENNIKNIIELLVVKNVSINTMNEFNQNILHLACKKGYFVVIDYLLELNCNRDLIDNYGNAPIHYVIEEFVKDCKGNEMYNYKNLKTKYLHGNNIDTSYLSKLMMSAIIEEIEGIKKEERDAVFGGGEEGHVMRGGDMTTAPLTTSLEDLQKFVELNRLFKGKEIEDMMKNNVESIGDKYLELLTKTDVKLMKSEIQKKVLEQKEGFKQLYADFNVNMSDISNYDTFADYARQTQVKIADEKKVCTDIIKEKINKTFKTDSVANINKNLNTITDIYNNALFCIYLLYYIYKNLQAVTLHKYSIRNLGKDLSTQLEFFISILQQILLFQLKPINDEIDNPNYYTKIEDGYNVLVDVDIKGEIYNIHFVNRLLNIDVYNMDYYVAILKSIMYIGIVILRYNKKKIYNNNYNDDNSERHVIVYIIEKLINKLKDAKADFVSFASNKHEFINNYDNLIHTLQMMCDTINTKGDNEHHIFLQLRKYIAFIIMKHVVKKDNKFSYYDFNKKKNIDHTLPTKLSSEFKLIQVDSKFKDKFKKTHGVNEKTPLSYFVSKKSPIIIDNLDNFDTDTCYDNVYMIGNQILNNKVYNDIQEQATIFKVINVEYTLYDIVNNILNNYTEQDNGFPDTKGHKFIPFIEKNTNSAHQIGDYINSSKFILDDMYLLCIYIQKNIELFEKIDESTDFDTYNNKNSTSFYKLYYNYELILNIINNLMLIRHELYSKFDVYQLHLDIYELKKYMIENESTINQRTIFGDVDNTTKPIYDYFKLYFDEIETCLEKLTNNLGNIDDILNKLYKSLQKCTDIFNDIIKQQNKILGYVYLQKYIGCILKSEKTPLYLMYFNNIYTIPNKLPQNFIDYFLKNFNEPHFNEYLLYFNNTNELYIDNIIIPQFYKIIIHNNDYYIEQVLVTSAEVASAEVTGVEVTGNRIITILYNQLINNNRFTFIKKDMLDVCTDNKSPIALNVANYLIPIIIANIVFMVANTDVVVPAREGGQVGGSYNGIIDKVVQSIGTSQNKNAKELGTMIDTLKGDQQLLKKFVNQYIIKLIEENISIYINDECGQIIKQQVEKIKIVPAYQVVVTLAELQFLEVRSGINILQVIRDLNTSSGISQLIVNIYSSRSLKSKPSGKKVFKNKCTNATSSNFECIRRLGIRLKDRNGNTVLNRLIDQYNLPAIETLIVMDSGIKTFRNNRNQTPQEYTASLIKIIADKYDENTIKSRIAKYGYLLKSYLEPIAATNTELELFTDEEFIVTVIKYNLCMFNEYLWFKMYEFNNNLTLDDINNLKIMIKNQLKTDLTEETILINKAIPKIRDDNGIVQRNTFGNEDIIAELQEEIKELKNKKKQLLLNSPSVVVGDIDAKIAEKQASFDSYGTVKSTKFGVDADDINYIETNSRIISNYSTYEQNIKRKLFYKLYYDVIRLCFEKEDYDTTICNKPKVLTAPLPSQPKQLICNLTSLILRLQLGNDKSTCEKLLSFYNHFVDKIYEDYHDLDTHEDAEYNYIQYTILMIIKINVGYIIANELLNKLTIYCNKNFSNAINNSKKDTNYNIKILFSYMQEAIIDEIIDKLGVANPEKQYTKSDRHDEIIFDGFKLAYSFVESEKNKKDIKDITDFYRIMAGNIAKNSYDEMQAILDDMKKKSLLTAIYTTIS
jgi:hypothetical protein